LNIHLVFTNEKGELTILTTKHFLVSYTTQKVCFLTTNLLWPQWICWATNRNIYFLTTDLRVITAAIILLSYTDDLFSYHRSWPFAIAELLALVDLFPKASGQKYMQLAGIIHTSILYGKHMTVCVYSRCHLPLLWGREISEQIYPKNSQCKLNYNCITLLHYVLLSLLFCFFYCEKEGERLLQVPPPAQSPIWHTNLARGTQVVVSPDRTCTVVGILFQICSLQASKS